MSKQQYINHQAFKRVFQPHRLTMGLIAPFKGYASPFPTLDDFAELSQLLDDSPLAALWIRDVPLYDPSFGDVGQVYDPFVTLGYLAALTQKITLGSAGIISSLRQPILTAKQATSIDQLTQGRFILGLSTGDRPSEYPAFAENFPQRGERFQESWQIIKTLVQESFPQFDSQYYGSFNGQLDLIPKAIQALPMIAVGRARQPIDWIAQNADAWIWHGVDNHQIQSTMQQLQQHAPHKWTGFGYGTFLELLADSNAPFYQHRPGYIQTGTKNLVAFLRQQQEIGVSHLAINLKPSDEKTAKSTLQRFIQEVAAQFPANSTI